MYNVPHFKEHDHQRIIEFIHHHPFAFLCGCDIDGRPVATQVPVFIEEREGKLFLTGHIMKRSDHHKAFLENPNVLCVFTGASNYVSATWYSDPHLASTWNYISVHARGSLRFLNEEGLVAVLKKTTLHFEKGNTASTTIYDNLPEDYRNNLMKGIDAFEIAVEKIDNVFKLSQNRDEDSYHNIISELKKQDAAAGFIADEMQKRQQELFPEK